MFGDGYRCKETLKINTATNAGSYTESGWLPSRKTFKLKDITLAAFSPHGKVWFAYCWFPMLVVMFKFRIPD